MHLLMLFAACVGLWLLFPKGFKYLVGSWIGFIGGTFLWAVLAIAFSWLIAPGAFVAFSIAGIFAGCVLAARG